MRSKEKGRGKRGTAKLRKVRTLSPEFPSWVAQPAGTARSVRALVVLLTQQKPCAF